MFLHEDSIASVCKFMLFLPHSSNSPKATVNLLRSQIPSSNH